MPTTKVPTFPELIRAAIDSKLSDTYHALPGIVKAYSAATMTADVQIAINDPRFDPDDETLSTEPWPVYPGVRVAWPRFGAVNLVGTLSPGDKVQCFFQDLDDSKFRSTGQQGDPQNTRRFGSDGVFCVPWDLTDVGVTAQFDFLALAAKIETELGNIATALGALTCPNDGSGTIAVTSTSPYGPPGPVASTVGVAQ